MADLRYLDTPEAELFLDGLGLSYSAHTLKKLRCVGGGPKFVRFARFVKYREDWLREWAMAKLSAPMRSTSDIDPALSTDSHRPHDRRPEIRRNRSHHTLTE